MKDIIDEIAKARRELSESGDTKSASVRRRYDAAIEDVWDACTDPERIGRWLLPVTGDFRVGGTYQLEGNAGGEILRCEPPSLLKITWVYGGNGSEVEVRLAQDGESTEFELQHTATVPPEMWDKYGPGAVGVGWDLALLGLSLHLAGGAKIDESDFALTEEGRRFVTASSQAWGEAHQAAGATPDQAASAVRNTTTFYAPDEAPKT
ncbi:SRPBCC family protein [Nonomuraea sp. NPDC000554]|uniref:SRPBCC family protein n=1 Tax=Nonomuraea sp. NPDC000554 TaxID=3154259 RepID=UPI00331C70AD